MKKGKGKLATEAFMGAVSGISKIGKKRDPLKKLASKPTKKKQKIISKVI